MTCIPQLCNLLTHSLFRHPVAPDRQSWDHSAGQECWLLCCSISQGPIGIQWPLLNGYCFNWILITITPMAGWRS